MPVVNSGEDSGPLGDGFTGLYSLQALLADCGGCIVSSKGIADGDDLSVYIPLDKEILRKIVRVFNESDARWDSLLDQHIDDLVRFRVTVIPSTVFRTVADVVREYKLQPEHAKEVFCASLDAFKRNLDVKYRCLEFVKIFLEKFCDICHEIYQVGNQDAKGRRPRNHVFEARYDTRSGKMELKTGSFKLKPELMSDVVEMLGQTLDNAFDFRDCGREQKAEEQSGARPERLESALVRLCDNWEQGIIRATKVTKQVNTSPWGERTRKSEAGARLMLLQTFLINTLASDRPRCRRDVIGTIVGTIWDDPYKKITKLQEDYDIHLGNRVKFSLNGQSPRGQKFRVLLMDAAAGDVLSNIPTWQNFPTPRMFLDGFFYLDLNEHEHTTCATRYKPIWENFRLIKNKDDPLPAWWEEYFTIGQVKTLYYLDGRTDVHRTLLRKPLLASWVSEAGSRDPSILSTDCLNEVRLGDEIDIMFSNGIANLRPKDLLS